MSHYTKSKIVAIDGNLVEHTLTLSNRRCHQNSKDTYIQDNKCVIKASICFNKKTKWFFVHFLNYNTETKKYIDNTLGGESSYYDYFIFHDNWIYINGVLRASSPIEWLDTLKTDIYNRYVKWWEKPFVKKTDI